MPIILNPVSGELDAEIVDGNFEELETFLKENVKREDFKGKFNRFKIRRYTSGKIVGFNSGVNPNTSPESTGASSTFENNWIGGAPSIRYAVNGPLIGTDNSTQYNSKNDMDYNHANQHPFELLGYPGGSMHFDFQEQGFADPASYYSVVDSRTVLNWPPANSPIGRFPKDECWSRWLTVPDAAGGVYVDEPCVAIITAQVKGNYFMTPALRVHGVNVGDIFAESSDMLGPDDDPSLDDVLYNRDYWQIETKEGAAGEIVEGMQESAFLRLGLFVDTNPIVWEDEFKNGDSYGVSNSIGSGHGYNPWIGDSPTGEYVATKPDGVAETRSWIKVSDITHKVRQRGSYKVVGIVKLKGRRRYNFSMKFRPAMTFGHVSYSVEDEELSFVDGFHEISPIHVMPEGTEGDTKDNPGWRWGANHRVRLGDQSSNESYFFPGGDVLVTNLIESSSISVEFFYGQSLSSVQQYAAELDDGSDPDLGV